ncbi:MAG: aminotransferase class I/II-fold pyridoxal phosphate-dependent enzyme [Acidimicrobiia bacterium]
MSLAGWLAVAPPPGEHGGDGARLAAALGVDVADVLDLSVSVNPCAPDVARVAARRLDALRRYPDEADATRALAEALGVPAARVVLTNGGAEAIALVAAEVGEGWVEPPEFSLYARHLPVVRPGAGRWRSNPRNPLGTLAAAGDSAAVWDEAFWPLATGTWTRGDAERGAIVVGSLTKVFACPGLRVGYVICTDERLAARLRARRPEWSVGGLACALVPELLESADLPAWAAQVRSLRGELIGLLARAGMTVDAADAPWVLVRESGQLREQLARSAILVRDCASFGLPGTVRIGVPGGAGLERVAAVILGAG